mmetsp:Transcript_7991/g.10714  ORF Transcript_7991/g.10714 Transcript_7991/m.10714 type:complete len:242 (+) Transcript_7991:140-865(+)
MVARTASPVRMSSGDCASVLSENLFLKHRRFLAGREDSDFFLLCCVDASESLSVVFSGSISTFLGVSSGLMTLFRLVVPRWHFVDPIVFMYLVVGKAVDGLVLMAFHATRRAFSRSARRRRGVSNAISMRLMEEVFPNPEKPVIEPFPSTGTERVVPPIFILKVMFMCKSNCSLSCVVHLLSQILALFSLVGGTVKETSTSSNFIESFRLLSWKKDLARHRAESAPHTLSCDCRNTCNLKY